MSLFFIFSSCNTGTDKQATAKKTNTQAEAKDTKSGEKLKVITTLFPLYDFSKKIAGDKANVSMIIPPGQETHSFEPSPKAIANIAKSNIFVYTGKYMEPWAEKIIEAVKGKKTVIVDSSKNIELMEEPEGHGHGHGEHPFEWGRSL